MKAKISEISVSTSHRIDPGNQEELKQTLHTYGMIHPIVVRELGIGAHPQYELIAGFRRLKTAEALGWTEVPITVLQPKDTLEQFDISMEENLKRKDFNAIEMCELLVQRKCLWEQKYGLIKMGPKTEEKSISPDGELFYEEAGRIFKRHPKEIYKFLQLQGLDDDLKKQVEAGEMYYRTALSEQAARKPAVESSRKKKKRVLGLPQPPIDLTWTSHDFQQVFWQMAGFYESLRLIENRTMNFTEIPEDQVLGMMTMSQEIQQWLQKFDSHIQDIMLQRTGMSLQNQ